MTVVGVGALGRVLRDIIDQHEEESDCYKGC